MPSNTGLTSAIIAIVMTLLTFSGVQLTDAVRLDVQNIIAEIVVLVSLAWTAWRHWHDKGTVMKLSAQVVADGKVPIAGPAKDAIPTPIAVAKAQQTVRKEAVK